METESLFCLLLLFNECQAKFNLSRSAVVCCCLIFYCGDSQISVLSSLIKVGTSGKNKERFLSQEETRKKRLVLTCHFTRFFDVWFVNPCWCAVSFTKFYFFTISIHRRFFLCLFLFKVILLLFFVCLQFKQSHFFFKDVHNLFRFHKI